MRHAATAYGQDLFTAPMNAGPAAEPTKLDPASSTWWLKTWWTWRRSWGHKAFRLLVDVLGLFDPDLQHSRGGYGTDGIQQENHAHATADETPLQRAFLIHRALQARGH